MSNDKIKITVETAGPIYEKSGIIGPLTHPFLEERGVVARMIMNGKKVVEHLEDGETKVLTVRDARSLSIGQRVIANNKLQEDELKKIEAIGAKKKKDDEAREAAVQKAAEKIAAKEEQKNNPAPKPAPVVTQPQAKANKQEQKAQVNDAPKQDKVESK